MSHYRRNSDRRLNSRSLVSRFYRLFVGLEDSEKPLERLVPTPGSSSDLKAGVNELVGNRKLVNPPAVLRNEDRQFFHHELGLTDGANHVCPGRGVPLLRHFLAGVATPTFDVGMTGKHSAIDFR